MLFYRVEDINKTLVRAIYYKQILYSWYIAFTVFNFFKLSEISRVCY